MNMTFIDYSTSRGSRWNQMGRRISEWGRRIYSRHELDTLSDRALRDIGLTRCEARREAEKPFWMA